MNAWGSSGGRIIIEYEEEKDEKMSLMVLAVGTRWEVSLTALGNARRGNKRHYGEKWWELKCM